MSIANLLTSQNPQDQSFMNITVNNLNVIGTATGTFPGAGGTSSVPWTPQLLFNGSSTGITYVTPPTATSNVIGNMVFINGSMQLSSIGAFAGDAIPTISGLVVPVGTSVLPSAISCTWGACSLDTGATIVTMHSIPSSSTLSLNQCYSNGPTEIDLYWMFMTNSSVINFSGFYFSS
jgi:hypothetical protein